MWVAVRGFEGLRERSRGSRGRGGWELIMRIILNINVTLTITSRVRSYVDEYEINKYNK